MRANTSFITGNYERLGQALVRMIAGKAGPSERDTLIVVTPLLLSYAAGAALAAILLMHHVPHILLFVAAVIAAIGFAKRAGTRGGA